MAMVDALLAGEAEVVLTGHSGQNLSTTFVERVRLAGHRRPDESFAATEQLRYIALLAVFANQ